VPHHIVEEDVSLNDGAIAHVIIYKLSLGDALTLLVAILVAMHCFAIGSLVSEVVDEGLQHLSFHPVAVFELGMLDWVVRRLYIAVTENNTLQCVANTVKFARNMRVPNSISGRNNIDHCP